MARATTVTTLTFDRDHVASLVQHSLRAESRSPSMDQQHMEEVPPGLWLVADGGVYLMSNGQDENGKHGWRAHEPAYAKAADPGAVPFDELWEVRGQVFDGSDGCQFIEIEFAMTWCDQAIGTFALELRDDSEYIEYVPDPTP